MKNSTFSDYITARFETKKANNSKYSFRAFCRDLQMSPGRMVNFIKGREYPSQDTIEKICLNLKLNSDEIKNLTSIIEEEKYLRRGNKFSKRISAEEFRKISDWKTWSIYTLFQSHDFQPSADHIAEKLSLSVDDVNLSLKKLEEVGLIKSGKTFYELAVRNITTSNDTPCEYLRRTHKEFISLAMKSIDVIPVQERDITGITMCIDKSKLPELKKLISEFRAKFNQLAETPEATDLYQLNIQFFPVKDMDQRK